jgi:endonuclease-3
MKVSQRNRIFERFQEKNPQPKTELNYSSHFELLIAVMLSAQATDIGVNKATHFLFQKAKTPGEMLAMGDEGLKEMIKTINLYKTKAKHILQTCELLIKHHHSVVPCTREELEQFPGVGRKTANVILNTAFDQQTIAVDTHIFRVANRTGLAPGKTPLAVEQGLEKNVPKKYLKNAHHWLILHGRYICKAKKPLCPTCLISDLCEYPSKSAEMK